MKALRIGLIVIASLALVGSAGYLYASSGVKSQSGYAELAMPTGKSVNTLLSLKLGRGGVRPARWLLEQIADNTGHQYEMPKRVFKSVLQELQGVQLRIYEVGSNRHIFDDAIAGSAAALKAKNWESLLRVREDKEQIVVMQYVDDKKITGLSIMASTADTALFLNLIGPFELDTMAKAVSERGE